MEMRLGKTLVAIRHIFNVSNGHNTKVLIIAPKTVLKLTWISELKNEGYLEDKNFPKVFLITGSLRSKIRSLDLGLEAHLNGCSSLSGELEASPSSPGPYWFLTNKEAHLQIGELLKEVQWDFIVLDESTFIKNPKAKVTKFFHKLADQQPDSFRMILVGNPIPNSLIEIYSQLRFIQPKPFKCKNFWTFRAKYFEQSQFNKYLWTPKLGATKEIERFIQKHCFCMKRDEIKTLPQEIKPVREYRLFTLPQKIKRLYSHVEKQFAFPSGKQTSSSLVALYLWPRQIAQGIVPDLDLDSNSVDEFESGSKDLSFQSLNNDWNDRAKEILYLITHELANQRVIITYQFHRSKNLVENTFKTSIKNGSLERVFWENIDGNTSLEDRNQIINDFKRGNFSILLAQERVLSHGIDLSFCDTMIHYAPSDSPEIRSQIESRIRHPKKSVPNLYIDMITEDTIEEHILEKTRRNNVSSGLLLKQIQKAIQIKRRTN